MDAKDLVRDDEGYGLNLLIFIRFSFDTILGAWIPYQSRNVVGPSKGRSPMRCYSAAVVLLLNAGMAFGAGFTIRYDFTNPGAGFLGGTNATYNNDVNPANSIKDGIDARAVPTGLTAGSISEPGTLAAAFTPVNDTQSANARQLVGGPGGTNFDFTFSIAALPSYSYELTSFSIYISSSVANLAYRVDRLGSPDVEYDNGGSGLNFGQLQQWTTSATATFINGGPGASQPPGETFTNADGTVSYRLRFTVPNGETVYVRGLEIKGLIVPEPTFVLAVLLVGAGIVLYRKRSVAAVAA